jgi:hypothetical protein
MDNELDYKLFSKLSDTILYENIYPYIYRFPPKELLTEIKQFPQTKVDLYRVYDLPHDQNTLYYDLLSFMNKRTVSLIQIDKGRENILRRHYMLKHYSANQLLDFYTQYFSVNKMKDIQTKCGVLWGLFTQDERISFIHRRLSFLESHL